MQYMSVCVCVCVLSLVAVLQECVSLLAVCWSLVPEDREQGDLVQDL